ncbi:MAG: PTS galactitol transporter subunit IIC [Sphaerochaetaceae bacterium]|nr:PTS galactitol transporter subunit IIC [Sphaerochaetaceae bacterium]
MDYLKTAIDLFFQFKAYVMLPIIIFIIAVIIRMPLKKAFLSVLQLGAGFAGIFIAFDFFVSNINPAVSDLMIMRDINLPVLDVGWPPLAAITWASPIAHLSIPIIIVINIVMLTFNLTRTIYLDIWNYWHFAMLGALVLNASNSIALALISTALIAVYTIKMADWAAPSVKREMDLDGITISPLSSVGLLPYAQSLDAVIERIPVIRNIDYNPQKSDKEASILSEPMVIGALVGLLLGLLAKYPMKETLELCVNIAAVMFILPQCGSLIGKGMGDVSSTLKDAVVKRFPHKDNLLVALDSGVVLHNKSILTAGIILMPLTILLALIIKGNRTLPLGDLVALISQVSVMVLIFRGNVFRTIIAGIPLVISYLLISTHLAPLITSLSKKVGTAVLDDRMITSLTDGGNPLRFWALKLFEGNLIAIVIIPLFILMLIISYRRYKKEIQEPSKEH